MFKKTKHIEKRMSQRGISQATPPFPSPPFPPDRGRLTPVCPTGLPYRRHRGRDRWRETDRAGGHGEVGASERQPLLKVEVTPWHGNEPITTRTRRTSRGTPSSSCLNRCR